MINLSVNGKMYSLKEEDVKDKTLWKFLKEEGYYVPILCNHEELSPVGRCRLCVVKDRGRIRTSCVSFIEDGMEIITDDPDLERYRKWALQFLFGERNHYCMYCGITSHCEFQNLGYYTKLNYFFFPTFFNKYELDNSHNHILFDNNRCVLCDRCVRVCSEVGGHFVLETINKGPKRLVVANGGKKLGESNCVSCGLCVQVCPTGTLLDKYSLYLDKDSIEIDSNCYLCPVGCGIKIHLNKNKDYIVKIYSDFDAFSKGLICYKMRYEELISYKFYKTQTISDKIKFNAHNNDTYHNNLQNLLNSLKTTLTNFLVILDGTLSNEEINLINSIFENNIYTYYPIPGDILSNPKFNEIDNFVNYLIINIDLDKDYGAIGSVIKRNVRLKNKNLFLYNVNNSNYLSISKLNIYKIQELENLKYLDNPTLIILNAEDYFSLSNEIKNSLMNKNYKFLILPRNTNDVGVINLLKNIKTIDLNNQLESNKTIIIFSRNLKDINEKIFKTFENNPKIIFALDSYENLGIINNLKNIVMVNQLLHFFEISASFYNMFNMLLTTKNIVKEKILQKN